MLGTNDLKKRFSLSAFDIAKGASVLVSMAQCSETGFRTVRLESAVVAPPPVAKLTEFAEMFEGSEEIAKTREILSSSRTRTGLRVSGHFGRDRLQQC